MVGYLFTVVANSPVVTESTSRRIDSSIIWPHRMHAVHRCSVSVHIITVCVSVSDNRERPTKTAELIEMPLGMWTLGGSRNHYVGARIPNGKRHF